MKQRLCDLHDSCRAKKRKVPASVSEAVGLAAELMNDAVITSSPGAVKVVDSRIDELTGRLASTGVELLSFTAKMSDLKDARDMTEREYEGLARRIRT